MTYVPGSRRHRRRERRHRRRRLVTFAVGAVVAVWLASGIAVKVRTDVWPAWFWAPAVLGAVVAWIVWFVDWYPKQDFTSRTWRERAVEFPQVFARGEDNHRQWVFWMIMVLTGIPTGVVGVVFRPGDSDRVGSAVVLVVCSLIGWLGLKALDARVARRLRKAERANSRDSAAAGDGSHSR